MNCLKCGREISAGQVFCEECLAVMAQYPVKPDAPVHLPRQKDLPPGRKTSGRKRPLSPEEQVLQLKRRCRRLALFSIVLMLLLAAAGTGILFLMKDEPEMVPVGRNYTIAPGE